MNDPVASLLFTTYKTQFGLQTEIHKLQELRVEAYRGSFRPQYVSTPGGDGS